jgi:hypothetical protein
MNDGSARQARSATVDDAVPAGAGPGASRHKRCDSTENSRRLWAAGLKVNQLLPSFVLKTMTKTARHVMRAAVD